MAKLNMNAITKNLKATAIGGAVKLGNYLYGTTAQTLECVEFTTGKVQWDDRAQGAASLCFADGRLYAHGENGDVALIEPSPDSKVLPLRPIHAARHTSRREASVSVFMSASLKAIPWFSMIGRPNCWRSFA